jgi:CBS domain-containing protein
MIIEGGALVGIVTAGDIERALKVSGAGARCGRRR